MMSEPKTITSDYTAVAGDVLIADATNGPFTITLPAQPSEAAEIKITKVGEYPVALSPGYKVLKPPAEHQGPLAPSKDWPTPYTP